MRHLSESEKQWAIKLADDFKKSTNGYLATDLMSQYLLTPNYVVDLDFQQSRIIFYNKRHGKQSGAITIDEELKIHGYIIEIAVFLKLLLDNEYIRLINDSVSTKKDHYYSGSTQSLTLIHSFSFDRELMNVLEKCHNNTLMCFHHFFELIDNDFVDFNEQVSIHEKRNAKISHWIAIAAVVVSPLLSALLSFCSSNQTKTINLKLKVDSIQPESQLHSIENLNQMLYILPDSIYESLKSYRAQSLYVP